MRKLVLYVLFFFIVFNSLTAQNVSIVLKELRHACTTSGGVLEYEILGDATGLTYKWSNGATGLRQENLAPGIYELELDAGEGCAKKKVQEEIIKIVNPVVDIIKTNLDACREKLDVKVRQGGVDLAIPPAWITWSDGTKGVESRIFNKALLSSSVCVDVAVPTLGTCDTIIDECESISAAPCTKIPVKPTIILNEFSPRAESRQFIELLVIGDGICGHTADIRGFIIQKSGGTGPITLAPIDTFFPSDEIYGFIRFAQHDNWGFVPNGSLITLYDPTTRVSELEADDPLDQNGDGIYILPVSQAGLLEGRISMSAIDVEAEYSAAWHTSAQWKYVELSAGRGGMHILYPDASLDHGYEATDQQGEFESSTLPYILTEVADPIAGCGLMTADFAHAKSYSCHSIYPSPGQANSPANQQLINNLRYCAEIDNAWDTLDGHQARRSLNTFRVYPNPTYGDLYYEIRSEYKGAIALEVYSSLGHVLKRIALHCVGQPLQGYFQADAGWLPGLYFIKCTYPDGSAVVRTQAIVH